MNSRYRILLAILSGLLLALSFPPIPFYALAFVGLAPLLYVYESKPSPKRPFLLAYLTFFIYHVISNWWVGSWQPHADPYLTVGAIVMAFVNPVFFLIQIAIYLFIRRKFGTPKALFLFPFIWTASEWFHGLGELSYPWLSLGYTQIYNNLYAQFADITGVWGISFVLVFVNVLILQIILFLKHNLSAKSNILNSSYIRNRLIAVFLLITIPLVYGAFRSSQFDHEKIIKEHKSIKVGIIQPNINPWIKWQNGTLPQIRLHQSIQDSLSNAVGGIDLGLWSETAITYHNLNLNRDHNFGFIERWLNKNQTSLLTGLSDFHEYQEGDEIPPSAQKYKRDSIIYFDTYNSSLLLNPAPNDTMNPHIYHKMKLTPFSERLPYADLLPFATKWLEWGVGISRWQLGKEQKVLKMKNGDIDAKIGSIICIESIYPKFCKGFTELGADMLVVITNDSWFDHTPGPRQHYLIACMRAVENRRYIARCANSGVSGLISATGKSVEEAPQYERLGFSVEVPLMEVKTIYVQFGDWLAEICAITSILMIIVSFFIKRRNPLEKN